MVDIAILLDDEAACIVVQVLAHVLQLHLELDSPHAVARAKHSGLTNEALLR